MIAAAVVVAAVGCSSQIVNTGDTTQQTEPPSVPTSSTRPSNDKLVNAFDYYTSSDGRAGYYFTTPSASWRCVIVPRTWAGCQSAASPTSIGIQGAPQSVTDDQGKTATPNSIVVRTEGDPQFASLPSDQFKLVPGPAKTLQFNKILAAAGFRCNVQEVGVSCISEETDKGFTFSATGATWQYSDVP
jgi:hypothetical protein